MGINYNGVQLNMVCYQQSDREYPFLFVTSLPVTKKNQVALVEYGRRRWKIENEGFDIQKNHGNNLEHRYSKDYIAMKNHYYLIQIGHMIAQMIENWKKLWENTNVSMEQKHRRLLEAYFSLDSSVGE